MFGIKKIADNANPESIASQMRRKRTAAFVGMITKLPPPVKILDVGGTISFWNALLPDLPKNSTITLLNVHLEDCGDHEGFSSIRGDARDMRDFSDGQFDLCFSNSVIEHVGTLFDQIRMGAEIRRVAKAYFVQTPYRYFPLEPHFLIPLWQFMPVALRAALLQRFNLGWMQKTPDPVIARAEVEQIRLINTNEMEAIFPDATIRRELVGPFTKSLIAVKSASPESQN